MMPTSSFTSKKETNCSHCRLRWKLDPSFTDIQLQTKEPHYKMLSFLIVFCPINHISIKKSLLSDWPSELFEK